MTDSTLNDGAGFIGLQTPETAGSRFNANYFLVKAILARIAGSTLVQVKAVTNDGSLAAVGYVDVQPMVNQIDGNGNAFPHGTIYHIPYFRLQGGANAIILDPLIGDIGIAIFADHDISSVKANKAVSNPGSRRRFDMADGLYIGGFLNGVPTQFIQFLSDMISIVSPTRVEITAPQILFNGDVAGTGDWLNNGVDVGSSHAHSGVMTGGGDTGPPV